MKHSAMRSAAFVAAAAAALALTACKFDLSVQAPAQAASNPAAAKKDSNAVLATVNGNDITELDIAALVANGLDKANAVDRAINREVAASLGRRDYGSDVKNAAAVAERDVAANIYATSEMQKLLKAVTDEEIKHRYDTAVKDADFNGYRLVFGLFPSPEEAKQAVALAKDGKADALKSFQPVVAGKNGEAMFISRNDVPYNLGVFVAKLKEGEFTEPALVRNGYIVLQAREIKANQKPTLDAVKESLRAAIADEKLAKNLAEARKAASVSLK